jgi:hypothetical protein
MTNIHQIRALRPYAILSFLVAAACSLPSIEARSGFNLDVLARDGYGVVQLRRPSENRLVAPASINGVSVMLILDSGFEADGIALDTNFTGLHVASQETKEEGISVTGQHLRARKGMAQSVTMGNVRITGAPLEFGNFKGLLVSNLDQSIESRIHQSTEADGFLTSGFLRRNNAIVDLHNLRLYLRPPGAGKRVDLGPALRAAGLAEVSFQQSGHGRCVVDVEVNGVSGKMVMDTGAVLSCVDPRFASQAKARGNNANLEMVDVAGVRKMTDVASTHSFKIGGFPVRAPEFTLHPLSFYGQAGGQLVGLLGVDVLGQNWGIIDFGQQKLYFAKAP